LRQKILSIDAICTLTDDQQRRLQLAGRGDIKRLIDRIEEIATHLNRAGQEPAPVEDRLLELERIKRGVKTEFSDDGSLFAKVLKRILTVEQNARFATLQEIERVGGRVCADPIGQNAVLDISLAGAPFDDGDLARLKVLTGLQGLDLTSTRVTDKGLVHLEGLTKLHSLDLTGTKITDAGLTSVKRLHDLERLDLFGTRVTAAGLAHLIALRRLEELNLSDTRITDPGLAHLAGLKNLRSLNLHQTNVTDAGLAYLTKLTNLEWLDVSGTEVSDSGLAHVRELRKLEWVNLSHTRVTDAGVSELKRALPNANVWKRAARALD
jgi:hypothetical protein